MIVTLLISLLRSIIVKLRIFEECLLDLEEVTDSSEEGELEVSSE